MKKHANTNKVQPYGFFEFYMDLVRTFALGLFIWFCVKFI